MGQIFRCDTKVKNIFGGTFEPEKQVRLFDASAFLVSVPLVSVLCRVHRFFLLVPPPA